MVISLLLAMALNHSLRGTTIYRTLLFLPSLTPAAASTLLWTWLLNQPVDTIVPGATTIDELHLDAQVGSLAEIALTTEEQAEAGEWAEQLAHVRCRLCRACQPSCAQEINIGDELGSDVEYDHYRTMEPQVFAAAPWAPQWMAQDLQAKELLISRIEQCDRCRQCEAHCPYGLPIIDMLQAMLPSLRDMVRIYRERLRVETV